MEIIFLSVGMGTVILLCIIILIHQNQKKETGYELRTELMNQFNVLSNMLLDSVSKTNAGTTQSVEILRRTVEVQLQEIRTSVEQKLDANLRTGLSASFARVNEQLERVYKSMGEVRVLTSGVVDLKNILSGVKTRGIWGEVQLYKLLSDFLAPSQFEENAHIGRDGSVEFAVRMPDEGGNELLLPIDSKFPMDRYSRVLELEKENDAAALAAAQREFVQAILTEAKKISEKYIIPPQTTDFAIMFLPSEGLYSEVIRLGMVDKLQNRYHVMVTGPSTLSAFLTSLQTGFRALSIRKHSTEIVNILVSLKAEFEAFGDMLQKTQNSLSAAQNHLEAVQKRSIRIQTKLSDAGEMKL